MPTTTLLRRNRAHSPSRGSLWSAVGVALATIGCAPPGPRLSTEAVEALRQSVPVATPLNIDISLLRAGDATGPRAILVHGTPGDATGWTDYLMHPLPGWEVVALDRPGFGRSGPVGAMPGLAEQAAAVVALLPVDGRQVVLLGHSLGGPVVAQVAADHPERIAGIVFLAASVDPGLERIHPMQYVGEWPLIRGWLPRAIRNANSELMALKPELEALAPLLARIRSRVVIVHGSKDDLVPVANVPYLQARLTGASCVQTVLLEGLNHFLPWNSLEVVQDALRAALGPVDSPATAPVGAPVAASVAKVSC